MHRCVRLCAWHPPAPCCHMQSRHEPWTHEGMFFSAGHVDAHLLNADTVCRSALLLFHARKQAVIVMSQMVRAGFWHRKAGRQRETVMPKTWKWVESCPAPLTCMEFISYLYMSINIHKQCKNCWTSKRWGKSTSPPPCKCRGLRLWLGVNLSIIKMRGKLPMTALCNYIMFWVSGPQKS